ncbi:putative Zinc finger, RING-type [Septoria linicola]|nr:putative Zinc finger, RING-type [Septoria linicola]
MSGNPQQRPGEREVVYCHQCENEWYRDEHGLVCPECQGDFVEVIEANNDPREEAPDVNDFGGLAPDPDEDDIAHLGGWRANGPGQPPGAHYHGTFNRNITLQPGQGLDAQGQGPGLMSLIGQALGPALQGILGGAQQQQEQQPVQGQQRAQGEEGDHTGQPQSPRGGNGTTTHHGGGPGFSYTITTSTQSNFGPRNAGQPQPPQRQPEPLDRMMTQMFMNIGAVPGHNHPHHHGGGGIIFGMPAGPPGQHPGDEGGMPGGPMGFNGIFQLLGGLGIPGNGVAGDHVYTQEGLDRIITQLMEQHQAGNAPPPASEEAIESLPRRKITEKDFGDGGKADCSICMDEAEVGSEVTELPCHHWFHHDCIKAWLIEHDTCPHCRQGITPKESNDSANRSRQPGQAPMHDMHSPEYQRSRVPGEYPFPHQGSGAGASGTSGASDERRSASPRAERNGGMFSRMREAFSPRDAPSNDTGGNSNNEDQKTSR